MTVPKSFIEQNHLAEGSQVELSIEGSLMTVNASNKPRYRLEDLLAEMPMGRFPSVEGWEEMKPVGKEAL